MSEQDEQRDGREVVWCWLKKYPCKPTCQLYDLTTGQCKIQMWLDKELGTSSVM